MLQFKKYDTYHKTYLTPIRKIYGTKKSEEWERVEEYEWAERVSRRGYYSGTTCMKKKDDMVIAVLEAQLSELRASTIN